MTSIIIRRLEEATKKRLRVRAARHGRSMEEEAREILRAALETKAPRGRSLAARIQSRLAPFGGIDLPEQPREPIRRPPTFGK